MSADWNQRRQVQIVESLMRRQEREGDSKILDSRDLKCTRYIIKKYKGPTRGTVSVTFRAGALRTDYLRWLTEQRTVLAAAWGGEEVFEAALAAEVAASEAGSMMAVRCRRVKGLPASVVARHTSLITAAREAVMAGRGGPSASFVRMFDWNTFLLRVPEGVELDVVEAARAVDDVLGPVVGWCKRDQIILRQHDERRKRPRWWCECLFGPWPMRTQAGCWKLDFFSLVSQEA